MILNPSGLTKLGGGSLFYLTDHNSLLNPMAGGALSSGAASHTAPKEDQSSGIQSETFANWGDDNLFPQNVLKDAMKNTIIPRTLDWKIKALYGGGLIYGLEEVGSEGEVTFTRKIDDKIEDWLYNSNIRRYLLESITDFYWFYNAFPEMVVSKDGKQITSICAQEATFCRWALQDKSGRIKNCYISTSWEGGEPEKNLITKVPTIDVYGDRVAQVRDQKLKKFIYPVSYPTPGKSYYQLAYWDSIRQSGWLKLAYQIPEFKTAVMENQITVKYMISVPHYWWDWKYPGFNNKTHDEKVKIMQDELTTFNGFLTQNSKAGISLLASHMVDEQTKKDYGSWKIEPIGNKIKDGIYIEDSQEASSHSLYALGVDHTLIGSLPGNKMGAGSGSDKRVAFNAYLANAAVDVDCILEPLDFVGRFNGWPRYKWKFDRTLLNTLDQGPTAAKQE